MGGEYHVADRFNIDRFRECAASPESARGVDHGRRTPCAEGFGNRPPDQRFIVDDQHAQA
jgi:hypothetical protein